MENPWSDARKPSDGTIMVALAVDGAPTIRLTFDALDLFNARKVIVTIHDAGPGTHALSFADAVHLVAGALTSYWAARGDWPPDLRPADEDETLP
jgi:hypothetical protein